MNLRESLFVAAFATACGPASSTGPIAPIIVESPPDAGAVATAPATEPDPEPAAPVATGPTPTPVENALLGWSRSYQCKDYDYFPKGGIQNFWCHRPTSMTVAALRAAAGGKIFLSGPHQPDELVLDARNDFGRYDPAFVKWLADNAPAKSDTATQAAYDRYAKPLARIFWKVLDKTRSDKACFEKEKTAYAELIAKKKLPAGYYERWFYFMNPLFCSHPPKGHDSYLMDHGMDGGVDGNVTKTVLGFWIRRSLDGTMDDFARGLQKAVATYDPTLLAAGVRR